MSFAHKLENLPIFLDTQRHPSKDLVAIRNDTDVFFLNRNILRCSTISSVESGFHLLGDRPIDFEANSMVMNSSGALLAVVGSSTAEVFLLPELLVGHEHDVIRSTRYHIKPPPLVIINQGIWHPALENNALVLLVATEDSKSLEIWLYDISLSVDSPQFKVPVPKDTTSIAFGSNDTLLGMLTLYTASQTGHIHCIYPLIYPAAKIRASSTQVNDFYEESRQILLYVNELCGPSAATESNPLKNAASTHHEVVCSIYHQLTRAIKPRNEAGFYIFEPIVTKGSTKVQGPVFDLENSSSNIRISQFFLNSNTSMLVAIDGRYLVFLAQYSPLLMKFEDVDPIPEPKSQPVVSTYKAPTRGFGYLDESDDEETGFDLMAYEKELAIWKSEFQQLSEACFSEQPDMHHTSTLSCFDSCVVASGPQVSIVIDCSPWKLQILEQKPVDVDAIPFVGTILHKNPNSLIFVVKDIIEDSLYFITRNKDTAGVKSLKLEPERDETENRIEKLEDEGVKNSHSVKHFESILTQKPFSELQIRVEDLSRSTYIAPKPSSMQKIDPSNLKALAELNKESSKVVNNIAGYTRFYIELHARVQAQIEELNGQIAKMLSLRDQKELNPEVTDRMNSAIKRQKSLNDRLNLLQKNLYAALETQYIQKDLQMSKEEKIWFKELNEMVLQVSVKEATDDKLGGNLASLLKEFEQLKLASPQNRNVNDQKFTKMVVSLLKKEKVILSLRKNLDEQMKILEAKIA